jgi:exodeoxyribonuclease V alpha subunit
MAWPSTASSTEVLAGLVDRVTFHNAENGFCVPGIGPKRAERITAGWAEQKIIREIMLFLHSNGVGTSRAVRIYKTYGADAIRLISENPYRLARDIRGIGFRTADQIAAKLGIEKTALIRVRAGISYALAEAMDEGHCGLPTEELVPLTQKLLEVPAQLIATALDLELRDGTVIADDLDGRRCVFLAGLHRAEREIAETLRALTAGMPPWPSIDAEKAIPWVEKRTRLALAESQKEAIRVALASKVLVITGGPGVGKTTLVNSLLKILLAKTVVIALCAPTGRAAKRLSESTGLEAKTIHRLLETDPRTGAFRRNEEAPLECDLLVVDETSMVDVPLMRALLRALPDRAALLVGDVDQLPSVGPGQVLADIIASDAVPVVCLTEIFRQAAESRIVVLTRIASIRASCPTSLLSKAATFISSTPRTRRRAFENCWRSCRTGSPNASGWIRYATSRCFVR